MNPIKLRRVTLDMNLEQVASACGWSVSHQSKIENGGIRLEKEHMIKLTEVLGLDFSNFMNAKRDV